VIMYLKERLIAGECLVGAGIYSSSPDAMEYAARGMDWIWWECQHTHSDWQTTLHAVRTGFGMGIPVLIRTWTQSGDTIERLLDTGSEGIIVPMVNTPEQAEAIVSRCYYPPIGERSYGSIRTELIESSTDVWNKRITVVVMIETPQAVENAEAIAAVPGVDALLIGAADLALRRGRSPDIATHHASVQDALDHLVEACRKTGKAAAVIAGTPDAMAKRVQEGFRLICAGFDLDHMVASYDTMREAFRKAAVRKEMRK
jgi:4-hydroxy-2-oxoheptanedioate aldolase